MMKELFLKWLAVGDVYIYQQLLLTGARNAQKAKHEEQKQHVQASLVGASKHCAVSFPVAVMPVVVGDGDQRT